MRRKLIIFLTTALMSLFCVFGATSCGNILNTFCDEGKHEYVRVEAECQEKTCTQDGKEVIICEKCHQKKEAVLEGGHDMQKFSKQSGGCESYGFDLTKLSTEVEGIEIGENSAKVCKVCRWEEVELAVEHEGKCSHSACKKYAECFIKPLGHDKAMQNAKSKPASCQAKAYCGNCKSYYGEKLNHKYQEVKEVLEETCTTDGWEKYYCAVKGCPYFKKVDIKKIGHDGYQENQKNLALSKVKFVEKSSYITSCEEIAYCGVCREMYSPLEVYGGHGSNKSIKTNKAATCTDPAYCGRCEQSYGSANGHTLTYFERIEPTCEKGREAYQKCEVCKKCFMDGKEVLESATVIAAYGHEYEEFNKIATCTEYGFDLTKLKTKPSGITNKTVCVYCRQAEVELAYEHQGKCNDETCLKYAKCIIKPLGHDYSRQGYETLTGVEKEISVTPCNGGGVGFCGICKEQYLGDYYHTAIKEPKCGEEAKCTICKEYFGGVKEHVAKATPKCGEKAKCKDCNKSYGEVKAHTPIKEIKCGEQAQCADCKQFYGSVKAHVPVREITCGERAKCSVCKEFYGEVQQHVAMTEPVCGDRAKCALCKEDFGPVKEHNYVNGKCKLCNKKKDE